jgi:hypothetical protein
MVNRNEVQTLRCFGNHLGCVVVRTIVDDDDFWALSLMRQRAKREPQPVRFVL